MKLLIKLYKPDGTCEEIRESVDFVRISHVQLLEIYADKFYEVWASGGRIEIAPIVE